MDDRFSLIPVTRKNHTRQHPDVRASRNKHGDLLLVFSPDFLADPDHGLRPGGKVLCGYDPESATLCLSPAPEGAAHARTLGRRQGFAGAAQLVLPAAHVPDGIPNHRHLSISLTWGQNDGGILLTFLSDDGAED